MNKKNPYEHDRLVAITNFIQRLITSKYRWENISDDVAELTSEIAEDHGHVIKEFDKFDEDFTHDTNFYFFDKPTEKLVKVSFEYENLSGGEDEI
tara:strand:+ start:220 stop:504 length:285 start_codon:yes stop_codon:yes gene_type:complete